ncbi:PAS domain S-box protein [Acidiferrimicrobium sp. IK]|uniref:sensor histidine kinase n=1 Tax=Acidiferrimicrobium sp. IK TaxID=2871700 RepID=UPI0021CB7FD2|nr:PAS domain S-box protein [Acidiferrimicrobium sp. IK]MCU4182874.1 PAS domain S-box protein [Acidiferrimicrobium sp. IK]
MSPNETDVTATPEDVVAWELIEAAPDGIVVVDADGLMAYVNRQMEGLTGCARADLLGRPVDLLVPDAHRSRHRSLEQQYRATPRVRMMGSGAMLELRRADGSTLPVEISLAPVRIGGSTMTAASVRDVSQLRQADRARRRLLHVLDLDPDAVFVLDAGTLRIEYANSSASALYGYVGDELASLTLFDLVPGLSEGDRRRWVAARFDDGPEHHGTAVVVGRAKDGAEIPCDEKSQLVVDPNDGSARMIVVHRDARDRLAAELLRDRNDRLNKLVTEVTTAVLSDAPPADVYRRVVEHTAELLGADNASLLLHDPTTGEFVAAGAHGPAATGYVTGERQLDQARLRGWKAQDRAFAVPKAVDPLPAAGEASPGVGPGVGPGVVAPFPGPQPVRGLLTAFRSPGGEPFGPSDVELLERLANQAATVVELGHARAAGHRVALLEDRQRIARDLHDTIIQDVLGVGMQLNRESVGAEPAAKARIDELVDRLDAVVRHLRTVVFEARQQPVAGSVTDTVLATLAEAARALGYVPQLSVEGHLDGLDVEVVAHLVPALREGLSNVARHAAASSTVVAIAVDDEEVTVVLEDDGRGMGPGTPAGTGVHNLQQRAALLAGRCSFEPRPGGGTRMTWTARTSVTR